MENADKTAEKQQVIGRPFVKGVSGNPAGRPKGSFSLKDKIRQYLEENPNDVREIVEYFVKENRELMWKMLECSPKNSTNLKVEDETFYELSEDDMLLAQQMVELEKSKEVRVDEAQEIMLFAQDIHSAYQKASPALKRHYLSFFWQKFEVQDAVIIKSHPTLLFDELLKLKQVSLKESEIDKPKEINDSKRVILFKNRLRRQGSNLRPIA